MALASLRPAGYAKENFAGKTALPLTPERVRALLDFVHTAADELKVPGVGIALIENGKILYEGGVGVRELGRPEPVDAHTRFIVASNTKGMTTLLLDTPVEPEQREYLETVKYSADALLTLLNDILDFSKIEAGHLELLPHDFSLQPALDGVLAIVAFAAAQKKLDVTCEIAPEVPARLLGDEGRLRQILINLAGNAVKFTPRGAVRLRVSLESTAETEVVLRFAVEDTGIGIARDKQALIFEAFRQADGSMTRQFGGTGLGLAICVKLVDLMAGRIWVESEPGIGSCFYFTARLARARATGAPPSVNRNLAPVARLLRVLLAEDNKVNQRVAAKILESRGHAVLVADTGRQAVDR